MLTNPANEYKIEHQPELLPPIFWTKIFKQILVEVFVLTLGDVCGFGHELC